MRRQKNMKAALVLLFAVGTLCSAQTPSCKPSSEDDCFELAEYVNASGPVNKQVCVGKKLVSLKDKHHVCHWVKGNDSEESNAVTVLPPLTEADSGEYTLKCNTVNGTNFSVSVFLDVGTKRPTKPQLILDKIDKLRWSPDFQCNSKGCPKTEIQWSGNDQKKTKNSVKGEWVLSSLSSIYYHDKGMMCCASDAGQHECSQLYDYDLNNNSMSNDAVLIVSVGQPLLLRSRGSDYSVWEKDGKKLANIPDKLSIKEDAHAGIQMTYVFIPSVSVEDNGTYTCRSQNKTESIQVQVLSEGQLSVQLDERKIVPYENAPCLTASVSVLPELHSCYWEAPNKTITKCKENLWETKERIVSLCDPLITGDYKLHVEAAGLNETKTISVCVAAKPQFHYWGNGIKNIIIDVVSPVPANYTWMVCTHNGSCNTDSSWERIPGSDGKDTDVSCNKSIRSILEKEPDDTHHLKFCLSNAVGSWCHSDIYFPPLVEAFKGQEKTDHNIMVLKVGCLLLFLALTVISVVLMIFVKKKKPQYQPQMQMIQMVGPNDNIYIDFKEFEYDKKWEFPRENLELGKELGSGAFGMVVQATAYGINKPGVSQQVAVKMLKDKHQMVEKEALMSELKMMTHIGHHTNIVNLLGACTESGPIYLIFQYCCYGDLLNYLKNNSDRYHKSVTDAFNKDRFSSIYHNLQPKRISGESQAQDSNYVPMSRTTTGEYEHIALLTFNSSDADHYEEILENPDDPNDDLEALTFDDLLSFAFQVAKGMEFLSSKSCIHRDLAARNILVMKGRMIKIGDFGLARDINNDSNYVVRGNVRLPVKWMAPESIFEGMYTMKSDVWAYGILLWEIFSLGVTPYPGMKVDHMFYDMIKRGYKMECPYYADDSVYVMMCKCWLLDPCSRPSFSKLVSFMCDQLRNREEMLYYNMFDKTSSDYQNAATILDISALATQDENKMASPNNYCQNHANKDSKGETGDTEKPEEKE